MCLGTVVVGGVGGEVVDNSGAVVFFHVLLDETCEVFVGKEVTKEVLLCVLPDEDRMGFLVDGKVTEDALSDRIPEDVLEDEKLVSEVNPVAETQQHHPSRLKQRNLL